MNYEEAVSYLYGLGRFAADPGLHRIGRMLEQLGDPHRHLRVVHVAGTNGKGSTCCFLAEALREAGLRVGLYTSPHLQSIRERIQLNGSLIERDSFANLVSQVKALADAEVRAGREHPTYFEILTAVMYRYFAERDVDILVQEVGLGGRFDATTVVPPPCAAVVTSIGFDHTAVLGHSLDEIAREKAGIIKTGSRAVIAHLPTPVQEVFGEICRSRDVPMVSLRKDDESHRPHYRVLRVDSGGGAFSYAGTTWEAGSVETSMVGRHQLANAALAVATLEQLDQNHSDLHLCPGQVLPALRRARWPGRLEPVASSPDVFLDGAHNVNAASTLAENLREIYPKTRIHSVVGVLRDKDPEEMIRAMAPALNGTVVATRSPTPRGRDAASLGEAAERVLGNTCCVRTVDDVQRAVDVGLCDARPQDVLIIWGSLYLVGAVRGRWQRS